MKVTNRPLSTRRSTVWPKFIARLATSITWRYRLWAWGDRLRVADKIVMRDPVLTTPIVLKLMALGRYEEPELRLLDYMKSGGQIGRGDRVIEAGGGLGVMTMHIADIVGDDQVVVFEPNPRTASALRANLALNGHDVTVEVAALSTAPEDSVSFVDKIGSGGFAVSGTYAAAGHAMGMRVRAQSLAAAIARIDPTVLVLDVEGAEHDLLMSIDNWARIRCIHLELHPDVLSAEQIGAMFERLGALGFEQATAPNFGGNVILLERSGERPPKP